MLKPCFLALLLLCLRIENFKAQAPANGFIQNKGQMVDQYYFPNDKVLFQYCGSNIKVQLTKAGYSYEVFRVDEPAAIHSSGKKFVYNRALSQSTIQSHRIDITFIGSNENFSVSTEEKLAGYLNYFTCGSEISQVPSFRKVTYKNVYPQVDIQFFINESGASRFKYNIVLHPGADPDKIKMLVSGASSVSAHANRGLSIATSLGDIHENIPLSFYSDQPHQNIPVSYVVNKDVVSFSVPPLKKNHTFVIDPSSNIIWATYYGDASLDRGTCAGTDAGNNVYLAGYALSTSNIATSGAFQATLSGSYDAFLVKFDSNGNRLWGTYFGGVNLETVYAIFVQSNGTVYLCGDTSSSSNIASTGAHQPAYGGGMDDAILVKFDTNGQRLWSTYYGGNQHDIAYTITVDNQGNPIIAGHTESSNTGNCIATPGAYATSFNFASDIFIAKFNSNGVRQWGTYYGDTGFEEAWGMDCDGNDNIVVTGFTESLSGLSTSPCHQASNAGMQDAFISKFSSNGVNLIWGTYFGGSASEQGTAVEIDTSGTIFVSGNTSSSSGISTTGAYQTSIASSDDAFLTAFSSSGTQLWGTYFGGEDTDYMNDILLDSNNCILFCGQTLSSYSISTASAYQPSLAAVNTYDSYFGRFTTSGSLQLSSYYGGTSDDNAKTIARDALGHIYLAGETTSTVGISTSGAFMPVFGGVNDGFLAKFCIAPQPRILPATTPTICMNSNYTLTASPSFPFYFWNTGFTSNPLITPTTTPGNYFYYVTVTDSYGCNGTSDSAKVVVANCVTSVGETFSEPEPLLFPNPVTGNLFITGIDASNIQLVEISDCTGRVVVSFQNPGTKVDVNALPPGLYFATIICKSQRAQIKVIKE